MASKTSPEIQTQAIKVAKGTQKPGQTKEQTKLIAQGIEKGIAEYKKQQNKKTRERDKQRKNQMKNKLTIQGELDASESLAPTTPTSTLPWFLLGISWLGFTLFYFL